jgi:hypothetical protein
VNKEKTQRSNEFYRFGLLIASNITPKFIKVFHPLNTSYFFEGDEEITWPSLNIGGGALAVRNHVGNCDA